MEDIPVSAFKKILKLTPICCVDLLIHIGDKFLLFKRLNDPARGKLWLPGGRINKGESIRHAVLRKAREETGMDVRIEKFIGAYDNFFRRGYLGVKNMQVVVLPFLVTPVNKKFEVRLDNQHSYFRIFNKISKSWHPYLKTVIRESGILRKSS